MFNRFLRSFLPATLAFATLACGSQPALAPKAAAPVKLASRQAPRDGRWLAVQFHAHSGHSDGNLTVRELVQTAKRQGLDALSLSDHDTKQHFADPGFQPDQDLTLLHSYEWTSPSGHAGIHGSSDPDVISWQDSKEKLFQHVTQRRETLILHHPYYPLGGAWKGGWDDRAAAVEVWNGFYLFPGDKDPRLDPILVSEPGIPGLAFGALDHEINHRGDGHGHGFGTQDLGDHLANELAIRWWNDLLGQGKRMPITGASDFHRWPQRLASPCTLVWARENTESAILEALRAGRSQAVQSPRQMRVDLEVVDGAGARVAMIGDTVTASGSVRVRATVTGGKGQHLGLHTRSGQVARPRVPADPWTYDLALDARPGAPDFVWARLETTMLHGILTALTSPIYLNLPGAGRD